MTTWVALLRGINVGGNNLLPMKELTKVFQKIGCQNVKTYIQSGNVVFSKSAVKGPQLGELIGKTILDRYGFCPTVHLLSAKTLEQAVKNNPFPHAADDPKSLHLSFLARKPAAGRLKSLEGVKADTEHYALVGNILYLHAPDGIGRSKFAAKAEKLLGVSSTSRNWRTVNKILLMTQNG